MVLRRGASAPPTSSRDEGGLITFAFCRVRPPESTYYTTMATGARASSTSRLNAGDYDGKDLEKWREEQIAGARGGAPAALRSAACATRRSTTCSPTRPTHEGGAQAIADEAAAGAYDMVVLSHGYFDDEVNEEESTPQEVAAAVQEIGEVSLVVC